MSKLRFATSVPDALEGRQHVVLLAPKAVLARGAWKKVFRGTWTSVIPRLLEATEPGGLGKCVSTWPVSGSLARVTLAVLPDAASRHLSPSLSHAMEHCIRKAELEQSLPLGIVAWLGDPSWHSAVAAAVARGLPLFDRRSRPAGRKSARPADATFIAVDDGGRPVPAPPRVVETVDAVRWAAALVDTPTSEMSAADFVDAAQRSVRGLRTVTSTTLVGDELLAAGLGGIHAVGRTATVAPRLLLLEYVPRTGKAAAGAQARPLHVALVGKGVVYDTGGLSLKPPTSMPGMKADMAGGAAVVGAFRTLAKGALPMRLSCLVPLAENAIGPGAYRPDDILTLHSGRTVEINNTDAEGRLLLADAVSYAARELHADVIVDAATLTGGQLVATGKVHAAVVSNREGLERLAVASGLVSGDVVHPLPFAPELFQREFKSDVADMTNSVKDRMNAQSACAAQFVWSHLHDTGVSWLHVDLAGPAFPERRATGFGVALLVELVHSLEGSDLVG